MVLQSRSMVLLFLKGVAKKRKEGGAAPLCVTLAPTLMASHFFPNLTALREYLYCSSIWQHKDEIEEFCCHICNEKDGTS